VFVSVTPRSSESLEGLLAVGDLEFPLLANQPNPNDVADR
jgi:hypothetical protein